MVLFFKKELLPFFLFFLIVTLLRLPTFSRSVLDWDESLYILMANQWLAGHLPYTTIWDNKPVGIYAIFAGFELVFRQPILAMRAATVAAVSLTAFGLWRLAPLALPQTPPALRARLAALAAAAYIIGSLSNDGLSANTEIFMECFSVHAMLAALAPGFCRARAGCRAFTVGLLFGLACMTKYVAVFEAPAFAFALLYYQNEMSTRHRLQQADIDSNPRPLPVMAGLDPAIHAFPAAQPGSHESETKSNRIIIKTFLAATAGTLLPPALTILTYAASGHLVLWWQCSILANIVRVSATISPSQLHQAAFVILPRWLPMVLAALILFAAAPASLWRRANSASRGPEKFHLALLLWLAGGAFGVASAKSFYDHYFLQILPPLCLALVCLLARPFCRLASCSRAAFLAFAIALLAVPAFAGYGALAALTGPDTPSRLAATLRPAIANGATLYVFDSQPILYALTGAAPLTRYVFPSVLTKCPLEKVAGVNAPREVAAILSQSPTFIVRTPYPPPAGANASVYTEVAKTLASRYHILNSYPDALLYARTPHAPTSSPPAPPDSCPAAK